MTISYLAWKWIVDNYKDKPITEFISAGMLNTGKYSIIAILAAPFGLLFLILLFTKNLIIPKK